MSDLSVARFFLQCQVRTESKKEHLLKTGNKLKKNADIFIFAKGDQKMISVTDQRESEGGRAEFGKKSGGLKLNWCICEQETWGYS